MSTQLPSKNPTGYLGLRETNVGQLYFRADDPVDAVDFRPYTPGDRWINTTLNRVWTLVKKTATSGTWVGITAGPAQVTQFTVDIGVPVVPVLNNVNLLGNAAAGVTTINSAMDTVTISVNDATNITKGVASFDPLVFAVVGGNVSLIAPIASQYTTDIGGPSTPALNNLNVLGDVPSGVVTTTTAPDTVSISVNDATVATKGVATFNPVFFSVAAGIVSLTGSLSFFWTAAPVGVAMVTNRGYYSTAAGVVALSLPAVSAAGDTLRVQGASAGGWSITQAAGQSIVFNAALTSTPGAGGSVSSVDPYDGIELLCITPNLTWVALNIKGNPLVV